MEHVLGNIMNNRCLEGEEFADGHHVGGEGTGLVGADHRGAPKGLYGGQGPDNGVLCESAI